MNVIDIIIKIASLLSAITIIVKSVEKMIDKLFAKLERELTVLSINQCKNYLVDFLYDLEDNVPKTDYQYRRAYEMYDHYLKLGGNSYIKDKWEKLVKNDH